MIIDQERISAAIHYLRYIRELITSDSFHIEDVEYAVDAALAALDS
jgi:hypothetical protein